MPSIPTHCWRRDRGSSRRIRSAAAGPVGARARSRRANPIPCLPRRGAFEMRETHPPERIIPLIEKCEVLPMDLADAILVLLAEWLEHGRIPSRDRRDFGAYRLKDCHPFENL